jgi:2-oxoglutarate ferredoxin oxidoreductase subunit delta
MKARGRERKRGNLNAPIRINTRLCKACWVCINACPKQVIGKVGFLWHKHIILENPLNCTGCGKCIKVCPYGVFINEKK